jgi:succinate dehydrogenase/fumarate reductase flavoprotein subunit
MRQIVQRHAGVFRTGEVLAEGVSKIREVAERVGRTAVKDKSKVFNTARIEALELDNLIEVAMATMIAGRRPARRAAARMRRDDFPEPRRRQLDEAQPLTTVPDQRAGVQAGAAEAADASTRFRPRRASTKRRQEVTP